MRLPFIYVDLSPNRLLSELLGLWAIQEHKYCYCEEVRLECSKGEQTVTGDTTGWLFPTHFCTYTGHRHLLHQVIQDFVHVHGCGIGTGFLGEQVSRFVHPALEHKDIHLQKRPVHELHTGQDSGISRKGIRGAFQPVIQAREVELKCLNCRQC